MAINAVEQHVEEVNVNEKINEFIQKNRKALLIILITGIVVIIGFVATVNIRDSLRSRAIEEVEAYERRFDSLRVDTEKEAKREALLAEINNFAQSHAGYAGTRASLLSASMYADQKKWAEAQAAWETASQKAGQSYLVAVALFNAAVAAEEQEDNEKALDLYTRSVAHPGGFPGASRAQFAIGRLYEMRSDREAALRTYRELVARWPNDSVWAPLAQNRIIFLSSQ
ncbi:MAG: tetratricopeptide repeat protein [Treponema sp.]|jgi:predicted negative regulator of RcsB-dependent stress response|nr:tetratricopeptide repeat protein [Treponema sp.]